MNIAGENVENFAGVFSLINKMYPRSVIDIENDNITPLDERTRLMFSKVLSSEQPSYYIIYEPDAIFRNKSENSCRKLRRKIREELSKTHWVFIQTETPSRQFTNSEVMLTEELVKLLAMLYFRAKGYMVQYPLRTYNGVDDVVIWKSGITEKLREHGFIEYGCYVDELRFLRKLGKVIQTKREEVSNTEFILVEAESCLNNAVKNDGGMNQLIGREWKESSPQKYREGARKLSVASKLFITFPAYFPIRFPEAKCFDDIVFEFSRRQDSRKKLGIICWETDKPNFKDSDEFDHENMNEEIVKEIVKYENHIKQLLLENFYFEELPSLLGKLHIDFTRKTTGEVLKHLETNLQDIDADIIISELDKLLE